MHCWTPSCGSCTWPARSPPVSGLRSPADPDSSAGNETVSFKLVFPKYLLSKMADPSPEPGTLLLNYLLRNSTYSDHHSDTVQAVTLQGHEVNFQVSKTAEEKGDGVELVVSSKSVLSLCKLHLSVLERVQTLLDDTELVTGDGTVNHKLPNLEGLQEELNSLQEHLYRVTNFGLESSLDQVCDATLQFYTKLLQVPIQL